MTEKKTRAKKVKVDVISTEQSKDITDLLKAISEQPITEIKTIEGEKTISIHYYSTKELYRTITVQGLPDFITEHKLQAQAVEYALGKPYLESGGFTFTKNYRE